MHLGKSYDYKVVKWYFWRLEKRTEKRGIVLRDVASDKKGN